VTHSIEINELNQRLSGPDPMILLDVRRKADAEADPRCISGAVYCDPEKLDAWVKALPAGSHTVIYYVKGVSVNQPLTERLRRERVEAVFLEEGLKARVEGGQPVAEVRPSGGPYAIQANSSLSGRS
jgi:hypothetical protein